MYTYIYSACLQRKAYTRKLEAIETRLGVFGISGEIRRLSHFFTLDGLARDILKRKNQTVVVVGEDRTLFDVINLFAGKPVCVGFIPIGDSFYGKLLGISLGEAACEVVAARRVETLDMGRIDRHYFLESAVGDLPVHAVIRCGDFHLTSKRRARVSFANVGFGSPMDGVFETIIESRPIFSRAWQIDALVSVPECSLEGAEVNLVLDRFEKVDHVSQITIESGVLQMIVGRGKRFD